MAKDVTDSKAAAEKLKVAKLELERLAMRLIQVQGEERRWISMELHDDIGQRLSLLSIQLNTFGLELSAAGQDAESQRAAVLRQQADELATDIHRLSHHLYSSKLQQLGLRAALNELWTQFRSDTKMSVSLQYEGFETSLRREVGLCLLWCSARSSEQRNQT
jgi:signal transduction histidine kinase